MSTKLETIEILDCKKIERLEEVISKLTNLKKIKIMSTDTKLKFSSLSFIEQIETLKTFITSYKIEDGNLNALLKLEDVSLTKFYKNYNLKDKDLPHTSVLIVNGTVGKTVKTSDLEFGKEDKRIVWMDGSF